MRKEEEEEEKKKEKEMTLNRYDVPATVEDIVLLDFSGIERAFYLEAEGKEGKKHEN